MKELLFSVTKKDFSISYYSGSGAGGQHRNKHQNCCRIQHKESGAMATGQDTKSREQNTKLAFNRIIESQKFKTWMKMRINGTLFDKVDLEKKVNESMRPENIKVEVKDEEGKWIEDKDGKMAERLNATVLKTVVL